MEKVFLETTDTPNIHFSRVHGSLRLKGWDHSQLRIDADESDSLKASQEADRVSVECKAGCMVRLPMESTVGIERVDGDLMIKSVECQIDAQEIRGQVMVKSIGALKIGTLKGHLNARGMEGQLISEKVNGNANLRDIEGPIFLEKVEGNLEIRGYSPGITAVSSGNATLQLELSPDGTYKIKAGGNIQCRLSSDTSAEIQLISKKKIVRVREKGEHKVINQDTHSFTAGEGDCALVLEAGGTIELTIPDEEHLDWDYEFEFARDLGALTEDISLIVTDQIENQLDALGAHLDQLGDDLSTIGTEASEAALFRIEAKKHKLERKLAKVERRTAERVRHATRRVNMRSTNPKPQVDPVSDQERQKVLEMLQEKKISVKDAETLLAALEGRKPDRPPKPPQPPQPGSEE